MTKLIIVRGISGSGKSTFAKWLTATGVASAMYEADMFMDYENGVDLSRLPYAHRLCEQNVFESLAAGLDTVVANTSLRHRDAKAYLEHAKQRGYSVVIYTMHGNFKDVHAVPQHALDRQKHRLATASDWTAEYDHWDVTPTGSAVNPYRAAQP